MWKSVSIHILKNTQANKPYGTEDRQVRKTLKSAKFVKSAIQTKTNTDNPHANGTPLHSTPLECGYPAVSDFYRHIAPLEQRALFATFL